MFQLLQSAIGTPGPLIVEVEGRLFLEQCMTIRQCHVDKMVERLKGFSLKDVVQTTDRSFFMSLKPPSSTHV
jgi:hypothetical protein